MEMNTATPSQFDEHIFRIPDAVWENIVNQLKFHHRESLRGTCRKFRTIANNTVTKIKLDPSDCRDALQWNLSARFPRLRHIEMLKPSETDGISDGLFMQLALKDLSRLPSLSSLSLEHCRLLGVGGMAVLALSCPGISRLVVPQVCQYAMSDTLLAVMGRMPQLSRLKLQCCRHCNEIDLSHLSDLKRLTALELEDYGQALRQVTQLSCLTGLRSIMVWSGHILAADMGQNMALGHPVPNHHHNHHHNHLHPNQQPHHPIHHLHHHQHPHFNPHGHANAHGAAGAGAAGLAGLGLGLGLAGLAAGGGGGGGGAFGMEPGILFGGGQDGLNELQQLHNLHLGGEANGHNHQVPNHHQLPNGAGGGGGLAGGALLGLAALGEAVGPGGGGGGGGHMEEDLAAAADAMWLDAQAVAEAGEELAAQLHLTEQVLTNFAAGKLALLDWVTGLTGLTHIDIQRVDLQGGQLGRFSALPGLLHLGVGNLALKQERGEPLRPLTSLTKLVSHDIRDEELLGPTFPALRALSCDSCDRGLVHIAELTALVNLFLWARNSELDPLDEGLLGMMNDNPMLLPDQDLDEGSDQEDGAEGVNGGGVAAGGAGGGGGGGGAGGGGGGGGGTQPSVYITDAGLGLLNRLTRLETFRLEGGGRLTDAGWAEFVRYRSALTRLDLVKCSLLTGIGFIVALPNLPLLERVSFTECPGIDTPALAALLSFCPRLGHVELQDCTAISLSGLRSLLTSLHRPDLDLVYRRGGASRTLHGSR